MATAAVINDSNGHATTHSRARMGSMATPMVQSARAHTARRARARVCTRTYRARTRVHVHILCTYTPSACISDFDPFLKIIVGAEFVVARPGPGVILRNVFGKALVLGGVRIYLDGAQLCKFTGSQPRGGNL